MATFDLPEFEDHFRDLDEDHQRVDRAPDENQLLGPFTVVCLFLNRTIGLQCTSLIYFPRTNR
jgi:hypothetical protein